MESPHIQKKKTMHPKPVPNSFPWTITLLYVLENAVTQLADTAHDMTLNSLLESMISYLFGHDFSILFL